MNLSFENGSWGFIAPKTAVFFPPKIIRIHFTFIVKFQGDTLPAELLSTEQIFTETTLFFIRTFFVKTLRLRFEYVWDEIRTSLGSAKFYNILIKKSVHSRLVALPRHCFSA